MTFKFRFAGPCREIPTDLDFQEQRKACLLYTSDAADE